jgi:hypothetical protein
VLAPFPLAVWAAGALTALGQLAPNCPIAKISGPALLSERAAIAGLRRRGRISPGGSCRLLRTRDAWLALNLARPDDEDLLSAWLETDRPPDTSPWSFVEAHLPGRSARSLVDRGRLLGLPIAPCAPPRDESPAWLRIHMIGSSQHRRPDAVPRVLDLSALWAGPLCTHLLERTGADVIKVESTHRPDGARRGPSAFYDLLNAGKRSVALDLRSSEGLRHLVALIDAADIVVESARPRALEQLGISASARVAARPGLTWLSITGYGRAEPEREWVAFGDDAAVAAGLATLTGKEAHRPMFCGDAIADPLAGMHAAVAALASFRAGGGALLEIALRDVTEHALAWPEPAARVQPVRVEPASPERGDAAGGWQVVVGGLGEPVSPPRAREPHGRARPLGADTAHVLDEWLDRR